MTLLNKGQIINGLPDGMKIFHFIYFLIEKDNIIYIGRTKDLKTRIKVHLKTKSFDKIRYLPCLESEALELEHRYLLKFKPEINKSGKYRVMPGLRIVEEPEDKSNSFKVTEVDQEVILNLFNLEMPNSN